MHVTPPNHVPDDNMCKHKRYADTVTPPTNQYFKHNNNKNIKQIQEQQHLEARTDNNPRKIDIERDAYDSTRKTNTLKQKHIES